MSPHFPVPVVSILPTISVKAFVKAGKPVARPQQR
jgi:hypothetical protein